VADGSAGSIIVAADLVPADGINVVYFAGVGGSSVAYRIALGICPDVALNHKIAALGVHLHNFPNTEHMIADVFDVDPREIRPGVKWRSFWASPDCRHYSRAKGSAPVSPVVRGTCWVIVKVAKLLGDLAPDVIFIENVKEFMDAGPLLPPDDRGRQYPDPAQKGRHFRTFNKRLAQSGYVGEWRTDWVMGKFGVATTRERLIGIFRRDGKPIVWPKPTHAPRKKAKAAGLPAYPPLADHIDWSIRCPSIFMTQVEAKAQGLRVKRPLSEATMARIAKGVRRYVIDTPEPFIVPIQNWSRDNTYPVGGPLPTIAAKPDGGGFALVEPFVAHMTHPGGDRTRSVLEALPGMTAANRGELALVAPIAVGTAFGDDRERAGLRAWPVDDALRGLAASNDKALACAHLTKFRKGSSGGDMLDPMPAATANSYIKRPGGAAPLGVVTAFVEQANTGMVGRMPSEPLSSMVTKGCTQRLVSAHLDYAYGSNVEGRGDPRDPAWAVSGQGNHHFLVQHELAMAFAPHGEELRAFLLKYYGTGAIGQDLGDPMHCASTRMRFGLVIVHGELMHITDIGMRMLQPKELAGAQGFPKSYVTGWNAITNKASTLTEEVAGIGNSVSPYGAAPFIACNLGTAEQAAAWL
jgi:DNA (cytosine-5)-methyltransferase 1